MAEAGRSVHATAAVDKKVGVGRECREVAGTKEASMQRLWWVAVLAGAGLCLVPMTSFALSATKCAELTVRIKGPDADRAQCDTGRIGGGGETGSATNEYIQVVDAFSVFTLSHAYAGQRTYLIRNNVKGIFEDIGAFSATSDWGEERKIGDFSVNRFNARLAEADLDVACVGYSLYSGHVARTTGCRHHIAGFYCDLAGRPPTDARIDELLANIDYDF